MEDLPWELGWPFNERQAAILLLMSEGMDEEAVAAFFPISTLAVVRLLAPMRLSRRLESIDDFKAIVEEFELYRYRDRVLGRDDDWGLVDLAELISDCIKTIGKASSLHSKSSIGLVSLETSGNIPNIPANDLLLRQVFLDILRKLLVGQLGSHAVSVRLFYPADYDHIGIELSASDVYVDDTPIESAGDFRWKGDRASLGLLTITKIVESYGGNLLISLDQQKLTAQISLPATNKFSRDGTGPPGRVDPQ